MKEFKEYIREQKEEITVGDTVTVIGKPIGRDKKKAPDNKAMKYDGKTGKVTSVDDSPGVDSVFVKMGDGKTVEFSSNNLLK